MASRQRQEKSSLRQTVLKHKDKLAIDELEMLMALALHKKLEYIYKNPEKKLNRSNILAFQKLIRQRLAGWSLAKLAGQKEFFKLNFLVNKHTLIPRPDSEILVEEALKNTQTDQNIIDIGTGSGALILSLAKNNQHPASYTASDISNETLKVAKSNARKLKLKNEIKFIKSDLFQNINGRFDIVIANLPYLTKTQMAEPSIQKEPHTALLSGDDGLNHYKKLLQQLPQYLNKKYLVLLEIDPSQKEKIKKEILKNLPESKIKFLRDLAGNIRVVKITH